MRSFLPYPKDRSHRSCFIVLHRPPSSIDRPSITDSRLPFVLRPPYFAVYRRTSIIVYRRPSPFVDYRYRSTSVVEPGRCGCCSECWEFREDLCLPRFASDQSFPFHSWRFVLTVSITRYHSVVSVVCAFAGYRRFRRFRRFSCPLSVDFHQ